MKAIKTDTNIFNRATGISKLKTGSKIAVALSGGIDSLTVAKQMRDLGYHVKGFHLKLFNSNKALKTANQAQAAAKSINLNLEIVDLAKTFEEKIINYFINTYKDAKTPSPCVLCNAEIKFGILLKEILENNYDFLATGHYAALTEENNKILLKRPLDSAKDQSYFLSRLTSQQLEKIIWPLAVSYKKDLQKDSDFLKTIKESQEICFIENDYRDFLKTYIKKEEVITGNFVNLNADILGTHKGLINYTIGQRRGLNVPGPHPYYVKELNRELNQITLVKKEELLQKTAKIKDLILNIPYNKNDILNYKIQIRYKHKASEAELIIINKNEALINFKEFQSAVTPGQAAAIYKNDTCLGSGWII